MTATINASTSAGVVTTADTSGILQLQTNGTAALTVDASQNVGIGTSSPSEKLTLGGSANMFMSLISTGAIKTQIKAADANGYGGVGTVSNHPFAIETNNTERVRIDSSGNLLVGTTASGGATGGCELRPTSENGGFAVVKKNSSSVNGDTLALFIRDGSVRGSISMLGTTAVAYNTTSDYRLKENVAPLTGALARVTALKPCTYTWKSAPDETGEGFIAHELAEVCPQATTGEKDAVDADGNPKYQSIDTSFLVATLTAAIQELKAIVDAQGAEIAALKGATA